MGKASKSLWKNNKNNNTQEKWVEQYRMGYRPDYNKNKKIIIIQNNSNIARPIGQAIVIKARPRMISVKTNYKGTYQNLLWRGCGITIETQEHVFEKCTNLHKDNSMKNKLM